MFKEIKHLYELGYAIHWLRPKSKMPIESGWTKGPRKSEAQLTTTYQKGFNVGVRLGAASQFKDGTYLCVIDCDVKSKGFEHLAEMEEKLKELGIGEGPVVWSGRGNGSKHIHCRSAVPLKPFRFSQSAEKVKVHMPSVSPSRFERETLEETELKAGMRLRPAWEISVMGEGQQVVLPPSIHPDSGKPYTWDLRLNSLKPLPRLNTKDVLRKDKPNLSLDKVEDFKAVAVDLIFSNLSDQTVNLILTGEDCEDRSQALFTVCIAMVKEGFTDNEILSVLTDPNTFLGQTAYDHRKTKSRANAASWVMEHTLRKVRNELSAEKDFEREAVTEILDETKTKEQVADLTTPTDWRMELDRTTPETGARLKTTFKNVKLILKNAVGSDVFRHNLFAGTDTYGARPPWNDAEIGQEVRNIDLTNIMDWLVQKYAIEIPENKVLQAVLQIASENSFHPVKEYLAGITWDGTPRIDSWLKNYLGADAPEPYLSAVSRKVLCAMVGRAFKPGCKFDHMLILEGLQGAGKSSTVRILADPWFSDSHINIADKDAVVAMRSVWVMEMGELSGMRKADVDQLKEFISRGTDRIRLPYGRVAENIPRQCIFIGTTNSEEYLKDTTGNRRFWPVRVGRCNFEALKADRDQLLAEAVVAYNLGEPLYLEDPKVIEQSQEIQAEKTFQDSLVEELAGFLSKKHENFDTEKFTISDLFSDFGGLPGGVQGRDKGVHAQMRVGQCLRILGFKKIRKQERGIQKVFWLR